MGLCVWNCLSKMVSTEHGGFSSLNCFSWVSHLQCRNSNGPQFGIPVTSFHLTMTMCMLSALSDWVVHTLFYIFWHYHLLLCMCHWVCAHVRIGLFQLWSAVPDSPSHSTCTTGRFFPFVGCHEAGGGTGIERLVVGSEVLVLASSFTSVVLVKYSYANCKMISCSKVLRRDSPFSYSPPPPPNLNVHKL